MIPIVWARIAGAVMVVLVIIALGVAWGRYKEGLRHEGELRVLAEIAQRNATTQKLDADAKRAENVRLQAMVVRARTRASEARLIVERGMDNEHRDEAAPVFYGCRMPEPDVIELCKRIRCAFPPELPAPGAGVDGAAGGAGTARDHVR